MFKHAVFVLLLVLGANSAWAGRCGTSLEDTGVIQRVLRFLGIRPALLPTIRARANGNIPKYRPNEIGNNNSYLEWDALRSFDRSVLGKFHTIELKDARREQDFYVQGGPAGQGRDSYHVSFSFKDGDRDESVVLTRSFMVNGHHIKLVAEARTTLQEYRVARGYYEQAAPNKVRYRSIDDTLQMHFEITDKSKVPLDDFEIAAIQQRLQEYFDVALDAARASAEIYKASGFEIERRWGGSYAIKFMEHSRSGQTTSFSFGKNQFAAINSFVGTLIDVLDLEPMDFTAVRNSVVHYSQPNESGQPYIRRD